MVLPIIIAGTIALIVLRVVAKGTRDDVKQDVREAAEAAKEAANAVVDAGTNVLDEALTNQEAEGRKVGRAYRAMVPSWVGNRVADAMEGAEANYSLPRFTLLALLHLEADRRPGANPRESRGDSGASIGPWQIHSKFHPGVLEFASGSDADLEKQAWLAAEIYALGYHDGRIYPKDGARARIAAVVYNAGINRVYQALDRNMDPETYMSQVLGKKYDYGSRFIVVLNNLERGCKDNPREYCAG